MFSLLDVKVGNVLAIWLLSGVGVGVLHTLYPCGESSLGLQRDALTTRLPHRTLKNDRYKINSHEGE